MIETKKSFCRFCHVLCGIEVDVDTGQRRVWQCGRPGQSAVAGYTCAKGERCRKSFIIQIDCWARRSERQWVGTTSAAPKGWTRSHETARDPGETWTTRDRDLRRQRPELRHRRFPPDQYMAASGRFPERLHRPDGRLSRLHRCGAPLLRTAAIPFPIYGPVFDLEHADVAMFIGTNPLASHGTALYGPFPQSGLPMRADAA